jgi:D-alanyl-D-alanine carboxypeptidase
MVATHLMRILHPWVRHNLFQKILIFVILAAAVAAIVFWRHTSTSETADTDQAGTGQTAESKSASQPTFNKKLYSVNDPTSIWVVVNKGRVLPASYAPDLVSVSVGTYYSPASDDSHLRPDTSAALSELIIGAGQAGFRLRLYSGYRSYSNQTATYAGFVRSDGVAKADTYSARPGHSEHQTGLAADLAATNGKCNVQACFGELPEGKWLAANAYKYGFIIRYQKGQDSLTGYQYEPWHVRFVGKDLAAQIQQTGQTLEQFFGLPAYSNYPASSYQLKVGS